MPNPSFSLAALGGGNRSQVFFARAASQPESYRLVAAADRHPERLARMRAWAGPGEFRTFATAEELLAQPRLADILIIGTQDAAHFAHAQAALLRGYDLLLEKPIADRLEDVLALAQLARRLERRVLVCHVLRYTAFYRQVRNLIAEGAIGDLVSFEATQGLDPWHQAHSYVRGHWGVAERCTPMMVANSCHDFDILAWLVDSPCTRVSSFGGLIHFHSRQAPPQAPARCTDGCPAAATCLFDAHRYLTDKKEPWLGTVFDGAQTADNDTIRDWLRTSKWGRCAYRCDNTTVDHQCVNMEFASGVSGNFTLTAFSSGRDLALFGTKGRLLAGTRTRQTAGCDILLQPFTPSQPEQRITVSDGVDFDTALLRDLPQEFAKPDPAAMLTSLERSLESHLIGFAAEAARLSGRVIDMPAFRQQHQPA